METNQLQIGKYVIVKDQPILFAAELAHSDVVNDAQSAGFFILRFNGQAVEVLCWGESIGLNIKSREGDDARIISDFIERIAGLKPQARNQRSEMRDNWLEANVPAAEH